MKLKGVNMLYSSLPCGESARVAEGQCILNYLIWEADNTPDGGKKNKWTRLFLQEQFPDWANGVTTEEVKEFCYKERDVSMYALTRLWEVFESVVAEKCRLCLFFIVNNGHCYPITDAKKRKQITFKKSLVMSDLVFDYEGEIQAVETKDVLWGELTAPTVVVKDSNDLTNIANDLMNSSGYMVEASLFSANGKMIACKHPDKDIMLIAGDDFDERKEVCDKIYARTGAADAKFRNESWGVIYQKAYELEYGTWKSSDYSVDLKRIFRDYSVSPYRACFDKTEGEYYSADIKRDYPSILMENTYRFPVYGVFDCIKPITVTSCDLKPGEYYVNKTFYMGLGTIKVSLGWYPYDFVISCLKLGYVDFSDITYGIVARKSLPADMFKSFSPK